MFRRSAILEALEGSLPMTPPEIRRRLRLERPEAKAIDELVVTLELLRRRGEIVAQADSTGNVHYGLPIAFANAAA